mmetsp:Transcript_112794/g.224365  ORF Transcript_112794/g.224365 Transcript_112794/m.224365 type:complete len:536 (-) Transcript_112794:136-1743(-)
MDELSASSRRMATGFRLLLLSFGTLNMAFVLQGEVPWQSVFQSNGVPVKEILNNSLVGKPGDSVAEPAALHFLETGDTHTHNKSFAKTLTEMVAGALCFVMSIMILWRNEGHAVRVDQLLLFAKRRVKEVSSAASSSNLRDLVCVQGTSSTTDCLVLNNFNVTAPANSIKLRAVVWMYQWTEQRKDNDGNTTYKYSKEWVQEQVDSKDFKHPGGHENPVCPVPFLERKLASAMLGDFKLPQRVIGQLQRWRPCELSDQWINEFAQKANRKQGTRTTHRETDGLARSSLPVLAFTMGNDFGNEIGDLRVCIEYVPSGSLTVLGVQVEKDGAWSFVPMQYVSHVRLNPTIVRANTAATNLGDGSHQTLLGEDENDTYEEEARNTIDHIKAGVQASLKGFPNPGNMTDNFFKAAARDEILYACEEHISASECLRQEGAWERKLSVAIRTFGVVLMYVSLMAVFSPLRYLLSHLWFIGALLNGGIWLIAIACTCCCSSLTISAAWLAFRPVMSLAVLLTSFACIAVAHKVSEEQKVGPY